MRLIEVAMGAEAVPTEEPWGPYIPRGIRNRKRLVASFWAPGETK